MKIDSKKIYLDLQLAMREVEDEVVSVTGKRGLGLTIYLGSIYGQRDKVEFMLSSEGYGAERVEVKGRDLASCVAEFIRRSGFSESQKYLLLGAPEIEQESVPVSEDLNSLNSDIPF